MSATATAAACADAKAAFLAAFESGDLAAEAFGHREHLRLAWAVLQQEPLPRALERVTGGLRRFTRRVGAADKYHETVTWAWVLLVNERLERPGARQLDWPAFLAANPDLLDRDRPLLDRYYRRETLASPHARRSFVLPDRAPG